jgi:hypothetical protein
MTVIMQAYGFILPAELGRHTDTIDDSNYAGLRRYIAGRIRSSYWHYWWQNHLPADALY